MPEAEGVTKLPSTRNKKLGRQVRREINHTVNQLYADHPDARFAYAQLHVAGMTFKACRMHAYLYASHLAHIPAHLAWGSAKRGSPARRVTSAYSFRECQRYHPVARQNRPDQQTFCRAACGCITHAAMKAAANLASRQHAHELAACADRQAITALVGRRRHQGWLQQQHRLAAVPPSAPVSRQRAPANGRRPMGGVSDDSSPNY